MTVQHNARTPSRASTTSVRIGASISLNLEIVCFFYTVTTHLWNRLLQEHALRKSARDKLVLDELERYHQRWPDWDIVSVND